MSIREVQPFSALKRSARLALVKGELERMLELGAPASVYRTQEVARWIGVSTGYGRDAENLIAAALTALARDGHWAARQSAETFHALGREFHRWEWRWPQPKEGV